MKEQFSKIKAFIIQKGWRRDVILASLFLIAVGCAGTFGVIWLWLDGLAVISEQTMEEPRTLPAPGEEHIVRETGKAEPETMHETYTDIPGIDFEEQWKINKDICAWICIPETLVNYPVLRNGDSEDPYDEYYLETTVEGESGLPGSIYMEPCNSPEFTDFNTVIYGHNMKNGTMFGELDRLADDDFFEEHEYVYVVTPGQILTYRIFGWVNYDDRHIMLSFDFDKEEQCQAFLDSFSAVGTECRFRDNMEVTPKDRILTLSTCVKKQEERRFLVEAVLVEKQER